MLSYAYFAHLIEVNVTIILCFADEINLFFQVAKNLKSLATLVSG